MAEEDAFVVTESCDPEPIGSNNSNAPSPNVEINANDEEIEIERRSKKKKKTKKKQKKRKKDEVESSDSENDDHDAKKKWEELYYDFQKMYYQNNGEYYTEGSTRFIKAYYKKYCLNSLAEQNDIEGDEVIDALTGAKPENLNSPSKVKPEVESKPDEAALKELPAVSSPHDTDDGGYNSDNDGIPIVFDSGKSSPPAAAATTNNNFLTISPAAPNFGGFLHPPPIQPPFNNTINNAMSPAVQPPLSFQTTPDKLPFPPFPNFPGLPLMPIVSKPSVANALQFNHPADQNIAEKPVKSKTSRLLSYTNEESWLTPANERTFPSSTNVQLTNSITSKMSPVQVHPPFRPPNPVFNMMPPPRPNVPVHNGGHPNHLIAPYPPQVSQVNVKNDPPVPPTGRFTSTFTNISAHIGLPTSSRQSDKSAKYSVAQSVSRNSSSVLNDDQELRTSTVKGIAATLAEDAGMNKVQGNVVSNEKPPEFESIEGNVYSIETRVSRIDMSFNCNCVTATSPSKSDKKCCADNSCANRSLFIECNTPCVTDRCANRQFMSPMRPKVEVFKTSKKGWGLRCVEAVKSGTLVSEFVGEVVRKSDVSMRMKEYKKLGVKNHYVMRMSESMAIDATKKGNLSRFINHSCEPNCELQMWFVDSMPRLGVFSLSSLSSSEEITIDCNAQLYSRRAMSCFCDCKTASKCRGIIQSANLNTRSKQEIEMYIQNQLMDFIDLAAGGKFTKTKKEKLFKIMRLLLTEEISDVKTQLLNLLSGDISYEILELFLNHHGLRILKCQLNSIWSLKSVQDMVFVGRNRVIQNKTIQNFECGSMKLMVACIKLLKKLPLSKVSPEDVKGCGLDETMCAVSKDLSFLSEDQINNASNDEYSRVDFDSRSLASVLGLIMDDIRHFLMKFGLNTQGSEQEETPESPADEEKGGTNESDSPLNESIEVADSDKVKTVGKEDVIESKLQKSSKKRKHVSNNANDDTGVKKRKRNRSLTDSVNTDSLNESQCESVINGHSRSQSSSGADQLKLPVATEANETDQYVQLCITNVANNELPQKGKEQPLHDGEIEATQLHNDVDSVLMVPGSSLNESVESGEILSPVKICNKSEDKLSEELGCDSKMEEEPEQTSEIEGLCADTNMISDSSNKANVDKENVENKKSETEVELDLKLNRGVSGETLEPTATTHEPTISSNNESKEETENEVCQSAEQPYSEDVIKSVDLNTSASSAKSETSSNGNIAPPVSMVAAPTPAPLVLQPGQLIFIQTTDGLVPQQVSIPFAALAPAPVAGIESVTSHPNASNQHSHATAPTVLLASAAVPEAAPILLNAPPASEPNLNVSNSTAHNNAELAEPQSIVQVQTDTSKESASFASETVAIPSAQEVAPSVIVAGLQAQPHVNFAVQASSLIAQPLPEKVSSVPSKVVKSESSNERVSRGKRRLPKNWRSAVDPSNGNTYYYHARTRHTQWNFPLAKGPDDYSSSSGDEEESDDDNEGPQSSKQLKIEEQNSVDNSNSLYDIPDTIFDSMDTIVTSHYNAAKQANYQQGGSANNEDSFNVELFSSHSIHTPPEPFNPSTVPGADLVSGDASGSANVGGSVTLADSLAMISGSALGFGNLSSGADPMNVPVTHSTPSRGPGGRGEPSMPLLNNTQDHHFLPSYQLNQPNHGSRLVQQVQPASSQSRVKSSTHNDHHRSSYSNSSGSRGAISKQRSSSSREPNSDVARKAKEQFMEKVSKVVVQCLNAYNKSDCRTGRIRSNEDFKFLARKLSHFIFGKEVSKTKKVEKLRMSSDIEAKTRNYVKSYMNSLGPEYRRHLAKSPK